jgi:integrase
VRCALRLAPLVFVRPGELRKAEWADIDLDAAEWRYTVTKTSTPHIVPLSRQAVDILRELHPLTGREHPASKSGSPESATRPALSTLPCRTSVLRHGTQSGSFTLNVAFASSSRRFRWARQRSAARLIALWNSFSRSSRL